MITAPSENRIAGQPILFGSPWEERLIEKSSSGIIINAAKLNNCQSECGDDEWFNFPSERDFLPQNIQRRSNAFKITDCSHIIFYSSAPIFAHLFSRELNPHAESIWINQFLIYTMMKLLGINIFRLFPFFVDVMMLREVVLTRVVVPYQLVTKRLIQYFASLKWMSCR